MSEKDVIKETRPRMDAVIEGNFEPHLFQPPLCHAWLSLCAEVPRDDLQRILKDAADRTFNTLNVDGATSTNDSVILLANGRAGKPDLAEFADAVHKVCEELTLLMAKDAEGGHAQYELVGEFDLHGKKQALTVVAVAGGMKDGRQQLTGELKIKQTDYGIKPYSTFGGVVRSP